MFFLKKLTLVYIQKDLILGYIASGSWSKLTFAFDKITVNKFLNYEIYICIKIKLLYLNFLFLF